MEPRALPTRNYTLKLQVHFLITYFQYPDGSSLPLKQAQHVEEHGPTLGGNIASSYWHLMESSALTPFLLIDTSFSLLS